MNKQHKSRRALEKGKEKKGKERGKFPLDFVPVRIDLSNSFPGNFCLATVEPRYLWIWRAYLAETFSLTFPSPFHGNKACRDTYFAFFQSVHT